MSPWRSTHHHTPDSLAVLTKACAEAVSLGFHVRGRDLRYIAVNTTTAEMNRVSPEHIIGKSTREVNGEMGPRVEPLLHGVLQSGQAISFSICGRLPKRADCAEFRVHYYPVVDRIGEVQNIATFVIETTQEKRIEEALRSIEVSQQLPKDLQEWKIELHHSLDVFDFAVHETCRLLADPRVCHQMTVEALKDRVDALDQRIFVLRKLLQNQSEWLHEASGPRLLH